ncbi:MAG: hypothetical protein AAFR24_08985 [Cyanobacteria bacterium J06627_3]
MTLTNWNVYSLCSILLLGSFGCAAAPTLAEVPAPVSSTLAPDTPQQRQTVEPQQETQQTEPELVDAIASAPTPSTGQPLDSDTPDIAQQAPDASSLPEIIEGMEVGMPYADARALIDQNIWAPVTYPPLASVSTTVQTMRDLGYEEVRDCAGTGLGLCRMEFIEREGLVLVIIVTTSEAEPMVWNWSFE